MSRPRILTLLAAAGLLAGSPRPACAAIEFVGILATAEQTVFALTDTETKRTDWVRLRESFEGHILTGFDRTTDTITLSKSGAEIRVRLKDDAKVKESRVELTGTISIGSVDKIEVQRATLILEQENLFPLRDDITYFITPSLRPDGTLLFRVTVEQRLGPNRRERISAPGIITQPDQSFIVRVADIVFSFTPKPP